LTFSGNNVAVSNESFSSTVKFFQPFKVDGIGRVQIERSEGSKITEGEYFIKISPVNSKAAQLSGNLTVATLVKGLNILNLSVTGAVPRKSEDLLNKLVENYIKAVQLDKHMVADSTI